MQKPKQTPVYLIGSIIFLVILVFAWRTYFGPALINYMDRHAEDGNFTISVYDQSRITDLNINREKNPVSDSEAISGPSNESRTDPKNEDNGQILWGSIDMTKWKSTPCIVGRNATEKDVNEGRAVFFETDARSTRPLDLDLPLCALINDVEAKTKTPVIIIQAVRTSKTTLIGYRNIYGGNGICTIEEIEILSEPDKRFK